MQEDLQRLQETVDALNGSIVDRLNALRAEMQAGFAEQRELIAEEASEQKRLLEEQAAEQKRLLEEQAAEQKQLLEERALRLDHSIARQGFAFDQSLAGVVDEFSRSRANQALIWGDLVGRSATTQQAIGDLQSDTADLRHRVSELERRLAG